ncbi:MAG TPA: GNAT family N-acyltransferase [Gallionellaceae bacterium]|nr:GNAT family N-acyltransferase [Gallionellaceae bacterium]
MLPELHRHPEKARNRIITSLARSKAEVHEAQRLRFQVFGEEMGARLASAAEEIDRDRFDDYCDHLLVRDDADGKVVGTYRILPPAQAAHMGGYYSEGEFDLDRLAHIRGQLVEVGRSCVHKDYRKGAVITQLWGGLAGYMIRNGHEYLIGCASIGMGDGGHYAASVYHKIHAQHAAPPEYRVFPHSPLPLAKLDNSLDAEIPPLIKGYLRLGAYVCGEPAWDPDFNTADLFILLPLSHISRKYARHFLGE